MDGHWQIGKNRPIGPIGVSYNPWRGHVNIHSYQAATSMWTFNKEDTNGYHITWHSIASVFFWVAKFYIVTTPTENWKQTYILPATLPAIRSKHLLWALIHISQVFSSSFNLGWMWYHVVPQKPLPCSSGFQIGPQQSAHSATSRGKMFSCRFAGHGTRVDSFKPRWKPCFFFMVYPVYCPVILDNLI